MTSQRQLDRLMRLRRQRTRLAEEALAAEQRRCRELAAHRQALEQAMAQHQHEAGQREQALFERSERRPLNAEELDEWRQTLVDDAARQEDLLKQRDDSAHDLRAAERERDARSAEWTQRQRAQHALERLQAYQRQTQALDAEFRAELEMDEHRSGRGGDA